MCYRTIIILKGQLKGRIQDLEEGIPVPRHSFLFKFAIVTCKDAILYLHFNLHLSLYKSKT